MKRSTIDSVIYAVTVVIFLAVSPAICQLQPMTGRANDANNQVGSGGFNAPSQRTLFNTGNLYITGNVTGGKSFRGYSPIHGSNSLFMNLPSTSYLGNFQRDSVGLNNAIRPTTFGLTTPYYNPASTVTNAGAIGAGLNRPGMSIPLNSFSVPMQGANITGSAPTDITYGTAPVNNAVPNSSIYSSQNLSLLRGENSIDYLRMTAQTKSLQASPLFGQKIADTTVTEATLQKTGPLLSDPFAVQTGDDASERVAPFVRQSRTMSDISRPTSDEMLAQSQELISPTALAPKLFQSQTAQPNRDLLTGRPEMSVMQYEASRLAAEKLTTVGIQPKLYLAKQTTTIESLQPVDIEQALSEQALARSPLDALASAVQFLADNEADLAAETAERPEGYNQALAFVEDFGKRPLLTLAGKSNTNLNDLIVKAEDEVRAGKYYEAANVYRVAIAMDPDNALLKLGLAHSLLAAGEYLTAAHHLTAAIRSYPAFGYLNLDLYNFIPDTNVFDIRRANLEYRLEKKEDYTLRFLLGYLEYYSGLQKFGIVNLKKAAAEAPADSVISSFPDILINPHKAVSEEKQGSSD